MFDEEDFEEEFVEGLMAFCLVSASWMRRWESRVLPTLPPNLKGIEWVVPIWERRDCICLVRSGPKREL